MINIKVLNFRTITVILYGLFLLSIIYPTIHKPGLMLSIIVFCLYFIVMFFWERSIIYDSKSVIINLFFGFWIIWTLLSMFWAINQDVITTYLIYNIFYFTIAFIFSQESTLKNFFDYIRFFFTLVIILYLAISIWEMLTWNHLPNSRFVKMQVFTFKPTAVFSNENDNASILMLYFPIGLFYLKRSKNIIVKFVSIAMMFLSLFIIILNGARLAILTIFLILPLYWLFFTGKLTKILTIIFLILALLIVSFYWTDHYYLAKDYIEFQFSTLSTETQNVLSSSIEVRIELMNKSFDALIKTWGFGVGSGNFDFFMNPVKSIKTGGIIKNHNLFLEILSNNGIILAVTFIYLIVSSGIFYLKMVFKKSELGLHYLLMILFFIASSIIPSSIMGYHIFWIMLIYALFGYREVHIEKTKDACPTN
ncbi:MAG: O-antigen ligase family protein [Candidatus Cloacimonetes bacterium]|nr:O-antigen ligase family protein [Candidatus Cloacimonadota bacterium]